MNQKILDSEENNMQINTEENTIEIKDKLTDMYNEIANKISEDLIKMKTEIEMKMKKESDKILKVMNENNNVMNEGERKRRKIITQTDRQIPSTSKENTHASFFNINLTDTNKNIKKLKPPNEENGPKNGLYEIYISKFDKRTIEKDIEEYIKENTNIKNEDTFKIEKLISKKEENKDKYVSFKILTFKKEIYTEIIDEKLWAPDFKARDYVQGFKDTTKSNYTQERRAQVKRYNNYYDKYTTKPLRTNYDRIQTEPTNTFNINKNWYRRTEYNETPRSTKRYREYNNGKRNFDMNREDTRYEKNQYKRNYDNNKYTTPYSTRKENFRYAPPMQNPTPRQKQKEQEQQQHQTQQQQKNQKKINITEHINGKTRQNQNQMNNKKNE